MDDDPYKGSRVPDEVHAHRGKDLSTSERLLLLEFELRHLRGEIQTISARVVELRGQIRNAVDSFGHDIHSSMEQLEKQQERHDAVLRGVDGKDGLVSLVHQLNLRLEEIRVGEEHRRRQIWALIVTTFAAVLSAISAILLP